MLPLGTIPTGQGPCVEFAPAGICAVPALGVELLLEFPGLAGVVPAALTHGGIGILLAGCVLPAAFVGVGVGCVGTGASAFGGGTGCVCSPPALVVIGVGGPIVAGGGITFGVDGAFVVTGGPLVAAGGGVVALGGAVVGAGAVGAVAGGAAVVGGGAVTGRVCWHAPQVAQAKRKEIRRHDLIENSPS